MADWQMQIVITFDDRGRTSRQRFKLTELCACMYVCIYFAIIKMFKIQIKKMATLETT